MNKLSRRKLAEYVVARAKNGTVPSGVLHEVAAYLIESGRIREADLVIRAIEDELAACGMIVADVASAHALSAGEKDDIKKLLGSDTVYFRETVDPSLIGGVRIEAPGMALDATISSKLEALSRAKL